jgi:hypothetical protein
MLQKRFIHEPNYKKLAAAPIIRWLYKGTSEDYDLHALPWTSHHDRVPRVISTSAGALVPLSDTSLRVALKRRTTLC